MERDWYKLALDVFGLAWSCWVLWALTTKRLRYVGKPKR